MKRATRYVARPMDTDSIDWRVQRKNDGVILEVYLSEQEAKDYADSLNYAARLRHVRLNPVVRWYVKYDHGDPMVIGIWQADNTFHKLPFTERVRRSLAAMSIYPIWRVRSFNLAGGRHVTEVTNTTIYEI